jgi:hypothetical protein
LQGNPVSIALNSAEWIFPAAEIFHIVGFGISIGTIALIDFSLLGVGLRRRSTPQLLKDTEPWTLAALVVVLFAGLILFLTDPLHYYYNPSFRLKITSLFLAIVFNYTIHRKAALSESISSLASKFVGAISLVLWVCVIASGLFIAFVGEA